MRKTLVMAGFLAVLCLICYTGLSNNESVASNDQCTCCLADQCTLVLTTSVTPSVRNKSFSWGAIVTQSNPTENCGGVIALEAKLHIEHEDAQGVKTWTIVDEGPVYVDPDFDNHTDYKVVASASCACGMSVSSN